MGEAFGFIATLSGAHCELEGTYYVDCNIVETPLEGCCDVYVHEGSSSLDFNYVSPSPADHSYASRTCS